VDCPGSPVVRLKEAGIDPNSISDLILTHFHPDHISGLPSLLMNMWLMGRQKPLTIHGLAYTLDRSERLMDLFEWRRWPDFYPVAFKRLPEQELAMVLDCGDFRVAASPVRHLIPNIGLRVEFYGSDKVLAYSCDTEPCPEVVRLAEGADVLLHEASGEATGHSAPSDAGRVAREAEVGALYLIHYSPLKEEHQKIVSEAADAFGGPVELARDFLELSL